MIKFVTFLTLIGLAISCTNAECAKIPDIQITKRIVVPVESFVKVEQLIYDDLTILGTYTGSGSIVVKTVNHTTFFLTAGHLCEIDEGLLPIANIAQAIRVIDIDGNPHQTNIVKVDHINDLCLLETIDNIPYEELKIAEKQATPGDKIFNIAAPTGIFAPRAVPVFSGHYSGQYKQFVFLSLPAAHGSSGSPVLNENMEIISIVTKVSRNFDGVAFGPTLESIKTILLAAQD